MDEEIIHLDFLGNKIKIGDKVVVLSHIQDRASCFLKRTVKGMTRCYIKTEDRQYPPYKVIVVERKNGKRLFELDNR